MKSKIQFILGAILIVFSVLIAITGAQTPSYYPALSTLTNGVLVIILSLS